MANSGQGTEMSEVGERGACQSDLKWFPKICRYILLKSINPSF